MNNFIFKNFCISLTVCLLLVTLPEIAASQTQFSHLVVVVSGTQGPLNAAISIVDVDADGRFSSTLGILKAGDKVSASGPIQCRDVAMQRLYRGLYPHITVCCSVIKQ